MKKDAIFLRGVREQQESDEFNVCPRCGVNALWNPLVLNPVSKVDNRTYICTGCGKEESFNGSFEHFNINQWWTTKQKELKKNGFFEYDE